MAYFELFWYRLAMPEGTLSKEQVVDGIVRLRRLASELGDDERTELDPVITLLEDAAGQTLSQSELARLLGVSHTTIGRWIKKGDIPVVPTPRGRKEISLGQAVRLLQSVEELTDTPREEALAKVIYEQRDRAKNLDVRTLLPSRLLKNTRGHRKAELRSLAYHCAVAQRLNKQVVSDARHRLSRWERDGRVHPTYAGEWHRVLAMPEPRIARVLCSDSERSRALRQSSPFAGVLSEQERRRLINGLEDLGE
jgi:excisionase family DNA binding protein